MNFPMEYPIFRLLYWVVNTPWLGSVIVGLAGGGSLLAYAIMLRWIHAGAHADETEVYVYPTPALHAHDEEHQAPF